MIKGTATIKFTVHAETEEDLLACAKLIEKDINAADPDCAAKLEKLVTFNFEVFGKENIVDLKSKYLK